MSPQLDLVMRSARRSTARSARIAAVSALCGFLGAAFVGCTKDPGSPFTCKCEFASDTDQAARQSFTVCALNVNEATTIARTCQTGSSISVDACSCAAAREGTPCRSGCSR